MTASNREGKASNRDNHLHSQAPPEHKFKVQLYDFSCEGLVTKSEEFAPFLKLDFDNFKVFKTDAENDTINPDWAFKAGFTYNIPYLEKLHARFVRIQCFNGVDSQMIGQAQQDLHTIACGPPHIKLELVDRDGQRRGVVKFICVMKMFSLSLKVWFKELRLTMQGCQAPAKLQISSTLSEDMVVNVPHSQEGVWDDEYCLTFATSLGDLLKAPQLEVMRIAVIDEFGWDQGKALLPFRNAFTTKSDTDVPFKVSVTYSCTVDGEDNSEVYGSVGELQGSLMYQNLPVYAQMAGGVCVDGQVEGGYLLIEGLPYPNSLSQQPPLWQDPNENQGMCISDQPHEDNESKFDDIDDKKFLEALDQIDLPLPWEKRREKQHGDWGTGRPYFADPRSRRTTWKDPRFMPENWDQRIDPQSGKVYFQYHKTRQTTYMDPRGCPPGWDMRLSKSGDPYFAYLPAMRTTFADPRGLPEGWDAALDDHGRIYFKNHHAKTTTWDDPRRDQQEVTLATWRQAQLTRWWREQVFNELELMSREAQEGMDAS
eukprot:gnl/TRDRNA2_/TRDRNA2_192315_c0_seq1.p1 gnl/TRDRNA2_/TRDRNA2_192315_c0~~gnl/TRDRNA2_/TRDRNA2_192315_c0_seq1.p1  ORF type:complete len:540 (+),score=98.41 gnl/TRDRNA2_/TRDRNA2_192315_c0_seq1:103-1722(+)